LSQVVIGIESTAHTAGVGIITSEGEILSNQRAVYIPKEGGIHPREAANHHTESLPELFRKALKEAKLEPNDISLVSYARGPGLGPCLRTGATAARAFAYSHDIPLLGVNHCVAHLEIGILEGATDPVLLYLSGGNTQVIAYVEGLPENSETTCCIGYYLCITTGQIEKDWIRGPFQNSYFEMSNTMIHTQQWNVMRIGKCTGCSRASPQTWT
jgi:tRNA A37 threonylcarbamoyltransferase TsaD